jgi:hypothetical protein
MVAEHCDAESTTNVLALLDEFDRTQAPAADPEHPRQSRLRRLRDRLGL